MGPTKDVVVRFVGDTGNLTKGADQVSGRLRGVATSLEGVAKLGAVVGAVSFFGTAIQEARDAERVTRQTEAVLRSTGNAAGVSAKQIGDLASKLSEKTAVDDEVIQHGENVLLTFTRIRNEAGRGNDIFNQTTAIALDMSAALSETGDASDGLQGNMTRLGKALNDPIAGISALTKVGVTFTEEQKAQIKALTESGDIMGAQKLILQELKTEFGGMAEATADSVGKAQVSWGNFAEEVGKKVLPAVNAVSNWALSSGIPALGSVASTVGDVVVPAFRGAVSVGGELIDMWQALPGPVQAGAIAMGVWALAGDRVTGILGRTTGPLRTFGTDVQTVMTASQGSVGKFGASMQVLQDRTPWVGRMGEAFRTARGDVVGFGATARGVGMASLSGLKSAAGGLMGVLGGPWGLAIAGATTLVAFLAGKSADAQARQEGLAAAGKHVAEALREQNGVINETARATAAKEADDQGLLRSAEQLGIALPTVTAALLGQGDALGFLRDRLQGIVESNTQVDTSTGVTLETLNAEGQAAQKMLNDLNALIGGKDSDAAASRRRAAATQSTAAAEATAMTSTELFRRVVESTGVEFDEAADMGNQLAQAIRAISDQATSGIEAEEAYQTALRNMRTELDGNSNSLNIHTATGQRNRDMLQDVSSKIRDKTLADIQSGMPMDKALKRHNDRIAALKREADRTFSADRQARNLITSYGKIPKDVATAIKTKGYEDVKQKLDVLYAQQIRLEGKKPVPLNLGAVRRESRGGFATGGPISGPGGPMSDVVPIWASAGEFMQRASAVDYYGVPVMSALNQKKIPKGLLQGLARGGMVWPFTADVSRTRIPKVGGPALQWAKSQAGKPYIWGGVGPGGYDCCMRKGTAVLGPKGARNIEDIQAGDQVWSWVNGELQPQTVTAAWQSETQRTYRVRTRNRDAVASGNHPFLRLVHHQDPGTLPGRSRDGAWGTEWARLDELKVGDLIVTFQGTEQSVERADEQHDKADAIPEDLAWLFGVFVGDGCMNNDGIHLCVFGQLREDCQEVTSRYWGRKGQHHPVHGLMVHKASAVRWLRANGFTGKSHEKRIPEIVWTWSMSTQRAFLRGYAAADGHAPPPERRSRNGDFVYKATSWQLMSDVRAMHTLLGDGVSNITKQERRKPIVIKGVTVKNARPLYTFTVRSESRAAASLRGGSGKLDKSARAFVQSWDPAFGVQPVLEITDEGTQDTYDLEVAGAHNFIADGIVVHNSGFMSAITNVIQKRNPYSRRFATGSFPTGDFASGPGRFSIGFFRGNPGHMAGTLGGVNVESRGGDGVVVGAAARGARDGMFGGNLWHLKGYARGGLVQGDPPFDLLSPLGRHFAMNRLKGFRNGGWLKPGQLGYNETSRPEPVLSSTQWDKLDRLVAALEKNGVGGKHFNLNAYVSNTPADVANQFRRMELMEGLT